MNELLSDRIRRMSTSATLAMAAKARELRKEGKDIIGLSLGEPDFNIPDFIKEAAKQAIDDNYSSYTPVDGYADLKLAISRKFKRDNDLEYGEDQIVVSTGAKQSLANLIFCLVNPGDEVILEVVRRFRRRCVHQHPGLAVSLEPVITPGAGVTGNGLKDIAGARTACGEPRRIGGCIGAVRDALAR